MEAVLAKGDFDKISHYIEDISGVHLKYEKEYLVRQRLAPILTRHGFNSFKEFAKVIEEPGFHSFNKEVISAICTHETSFFRDEHVFESFYKNVIPELVEELNEKRKAFPAEERDSIKIRIWSGAVSTGQELISLLIMLDEYVHTHPYGGVRFEDFQILGSDIDEFVLGKIKDGYYTDAEVSRGLSSQRLKKYFTSEEGRWKVQERLLENVQLKKISLNSFVRSDLSGAPYDVVFLRNVLIYFKEDTIRDIVAHISHVMRPGGYLILGSSENLYKISDLFESLPLDNSMVFRRTEGLP